jgi:polar amino acid transport system substrate-binding protein
VKYKVVPWKRAIVEARKGNYNAIIGAFKEDAPDFVFPEEEFGMSRFAFFVKKGTKYKYSELKSLLKMKIGLIKGYSYGEKEDKFFKENQKIIQYAHGSDPLSQNIKKLLHGRITVVGEDPNVFLEKAAGMGVADQIINVGDTGTANKIYIAFSPKNPKSKEYAKILTEGIRKLKKSGELKKILTKYGLEYWK